MRGSTCPSWLAEAQWYPRLEATRRSLVRGHSAPGSCLSLSWDRSPDPSSKETGDSSPPRAKLGLINRERYQTTRIYRAWSPSGNYPPGGGTCRTAGKTPLRGHRGRAKGYSSIPARAAGTAQTPKSEPSLPFALLQLERRSKESSQARAQRNDRIPLSRCHNGNLWDVQINTCVCEVYAWV